MNLDTCKTPFIRSTVLIAFLLVSIRLFDSNSINSTSTVIVWCALATGVLVTIGFAALAPSSWSILFYPAFPI